MKPKKAGHRRLFSKFVMNSYVAKHNNIIYHEISSISENVSTNPSMVPFQTISGVCSINYNKIYFCLLLFILLKLILFHDKTSE